MHNYMFIRGGAWHNIICNYPITFNINSVNLITEDYVGFRIIKYK